MSKLRHLIDRSEIWDCLQRCARGMDRHDAEMIASTYHPDGIDDHGYVAGTAAEFIASVNGTDSEQGVHEQMFVEHMHILGNHSVDIDGDVAHAETYYVMLGRYRNGSGCGLWAGRYLDRLEKRDGEWKIALRRVMMGMTAELDKAAGLGADLLAHFPAGTWDRSDLSYARPLLSRAEQGDRAS